MDKSFEKLINRVLDGRYRIESVVGIGGMAYVLRAADMQNGSRPVAIKVLNEEFNRDENAVKRFVNESETIAMVDSPNIVKIYDVAISDSLKYIVMEYIDGITLKDYIDKVGALGWKEAVHYVRQILTGLSHAHEKGIVHRDIKPQNVMLLRDGKVKVTDFGIAKGPTSENLTMTDKAIGTVNYISPEQASGERVDKKSDVYSVGIMLYEMLTGKLPFTAESPVAVAMMQVNDTPVPPREINPQIPVGLEQIILKAMSKKPEERFNCAMSMEKALEYFVKNPATVFTGVTPVVSPAGVKKHKDEKDTKNRRSMFPLILGITTSFFVVVILCVVVIFFSNGGNSGDGFASALDKLFGIEGNNSEEKKMEVEDFTGNIYNDEIIEEMQKKGYSVESVKQTGYANVEDGIIVNQKPEAGEIIIKQNKIALTLYVNKNDGEVNKNMPDCVGIPKNSAIEQIVRKFGPAISRDNIEIIEEFNESHAPGTVYDCIPQVGHEVDVENDTITLYVSKGK
ncbi:MAG: protein kinase, partial [Clostridia bacterium]|nr:protein kinase [Clostridia bacterium]